MSQEKKNFKDLKNDVIEPEKCVMCGTCVAACPINVIEVKNEPTLIADCIECGICYSNCPRTIFNQEEMEKKLFQRKRSEHEKNLGVYTKLWAAQTKDETIKKTAQDGGIVSTILTYYLDNFGEAAIVAGLDPKNPWTPKPIIATKKDEVTENAGTKYTVSHTLIGLKNAVKDEKKKGIAVVGTPCQLLGLSRLTYGDRKNVRFSNAVDLKIGLFCMETFDQENFEKYLDDENIDIKDVTKFEIRDGRFFAYKENEILLRKRLKSVKSLVRECCHHCGDFTSEFADISVGNVGSPNGWSTVIIRSKKGNDIFNKIIKADLIEVLPLDDVKPGIGLVERLAKIKKKQI